MTSLQHHDIVVIGAGIAGATIVSELLERGQKVCIVDSAPHPASACSSHPYAIAHPHVGRGAPRLLRLTRIAFLLAEARWGRLWSSHGIFQPNKKDKAFDRDAVASYLQSLDLGHDMAQAVCAKEAMQVCGIHQNGIWLPRGASLDLSEATIKGLNPQANLTCCWNTPVARLERAANNWSLFDRHDGVIMTAGKVIIAAALETKKLAASMDVRLPLRPVRGQLSIFSISPNSPWVGQLPKIAISGDGYCLPAQQLPNGNYQWMVGSSFDEGESDLQERASSDHFNREQAKGLLSYPAGDVADLQKAGSYVGVRCVAGDRLPIIGALKQRPGIFLATALGSRGALWSALAAKLITAQVLEDDFALLARFGFTTDLVAALAPARFFAGAPVAAPTFGVLASNSKPILPSVPKAR